MKSTNWKNVIITGASSGIGKEFAEILAKSGSNLLLISRNFKVLNQMKSHFENNYGISVIILESDLSKRENLEIIKTFIATNNFIPDLLINNAGFGLYGEFSSSDEQIEIDMIMLNIFSLTFLTKYIYQIMLKNGAGTILNVSSTLSFRKSPNWAVYAACKSYISSFTNTLAFESKNSNIRFFTLYPGKTNTTFGKNAGYENNDKAGEDPYYVAKYAIECTLDSKKSIIIPGLKNRIKYLIFKLLPDFISDKIILKL